MNVDKIQDLINNMEPQEAASALAFVLKDLFPLLDEDDRINLL